MKDSRTLLLDAAEGVFSRTVDMALWLVVFTGEVSLPQSTSGQISRAQFAADRFLEHVNYDVIKEAIKHARRRGWLTPARRRHAQEAITKEGKKRLAMVIPQYDRERAWDGRMHLVTYDIPETKRGDRDMMREYLRRIGCGRLQDSVWMTPYNPVDTLHGFIEERGLSGTVIVSDMGEGGAIGEEDVRALIVRVYRLEQLDERYEQWLRENPRPSAVNHWAVIRYLSILSDDPQLPFALLPSWWHGDKAYRLVQPWLAKVYL